MKFRLIGALVLFGIIIVCLSSIVSAVASFQINSFSCSPSEVEINSVFSCTAQIKNVGDASGSVSVATLYPDSNDWLESSNYPQSSGTSVSPGQSTEVTFSGLRATKSGNNGFSKIMLDSVTDTYVVDQNKKVNVINVVVIVSNSVSSAAMGGSIDSEASVTAGGNVDVSLTFTVNSGGCSIGSQTNPKTISGMTDGATQSRTWTITQGTSGSCIYTVSAAATGIGGVASKIDSTPSTITCTNCPTQSSGSSSSSGGGGGGGGSSEAVIKELNESVSTWLARDDKYKFKFGGINHTLTVLNLTETTTKISIKSTEQILDLVVGETKNVDFEQDGKNDISIRLKTINIVINKAFIEIAPLFAPEIIAEEAEKESVGAKTEFSPVSNIGSGIESITPSREVIKWIVYIILLIIIILLIVHFVKRYQTSGMRKLKGTVKIREGKQFKVK